jgi:hypothetical protein
MPTGHYRPFPFRTFFRWLFFILLLALIPGAPWLWTIYWHHYYVDTVHALNQSASYRDQPGLAESVTWHIDSWWPWVCLAAIVLFLLYLPIWWWARPARDPKRSSYG